MGIGACGCGKKAQEEAHGGEAVGFGESVLGLFTRGQGGGVDGEDVGAGGELLDEGIGRGLVGFDQHHCDSGAVGLELAGDDHVGDVDFGVAEGVSDEADDAGLVLVHNDDHVSFGDHIHGEVIDAEDAREAIGVDGAEDASGEAIGGGGDADADDVADEALGGLGLVDGDELDAAGAGEVLDVDDVDGGIEVGLEKLDGGESHEGVDELGGAGAGDAEGDVFVAAFADAGEESADALCEGGEGGLIGGEVELDAAGVDGAADFAVFEVSDDGLAGLDRDGGLSFFGGSAEVAGEDGIGEAEEGVIVGRGFFCVDIDGGAGDFLFFERVGEGDFIEDFAACVVDDEEVGFALIEEAIAVEEVFGGGAAGDVEGDDVELGKELIEVFDEFDAAVEDGGSGDEGVEAEDVHFHGEGADGDGFADTAEADDAEGFAGELSAFELSFFPLGGAGLDVGIGGGDFAGEGVHESEGVFCGGEGGGLGGVHDEDAFFGGGGEVDVIDADAGAGDALEVAGVLEAFGGDFSAGAYDEAIVGGDGGGEFVFLEADFGVEVDAGLFEVIEAFGGEFVGDENTHNRFPSLKRRAWYERAGKDAI